jgi:hypothetical protein
MAIMGITILMIDQHWLNIHGVLIKIDDPEKIMFEDFKTNLLCLFGPHIMTMNTLHIDVLFRQVYRKLITDKKCLDLMELVKVLRCQISNNFMELKFLELKKVFHLVEYEKPKTFDFRSTLFSDYERARLVRWNQKRIEKEATKYKSATINPLLQTEHLRNILKREKSDVVHTVRTPNAHTTLIPKLK